MAVYFVTGKLGNGKSLMSVARIKDYLCRGRVVATNLDIDLVAMLGRNKKKTRLFRLPDKPSIFDLDAIGIGNETIPMGRNMFDESKNGLLVLDECGTWFNSRAWNDKGRQKIIDWFLHARKKGWDIIFIVQDISIVDKQARMALCEHLVTCRRMDRITLPFIGFFYSIFSGGKLPMPKLHIGIVRYGDNGNGLKVDTWTCLGMSLYSAYDTKQAFTDNYEHGVHSILPSWYTKGRYTVPYTVRNIMRITRIYFRKYSRISAFVVGCLASFGLYHLFMPDSASVVLPEKTETVVPVSQEFNGWMIGGYANWPGQPSSYQFIDNQGNVVKAKTLRQKGYKVKSRGACEALITKGKDYVSIFCG